MSRQKFRGYINSAMMERSVPQNVQNSVVRMYCNHLDADFLLSLTEYTIPGCTIMLDRALSEFPKTDGICAYSIWTLPEDKNKRLAVYASIIAANKVMLFAAENMTIRTQEDADRLEDIFMVRAICQK